MDIKIRHFIVDEKTGDVHIYVEINGQVYYIKIQKFDSKLI